jgi:anti-sigma factor RsiW
MRATPSCPDDDLLEKYALGRLDEPGAAPIEEHLLICERCQDRLKELDDFVTALRAAVRQ